MLHLWFPADLYYLKNPSRERTAQAANGKRFEMLIKIDAEGQVAVPASVLNELGVGPGDQIEIIEGPDGFILRPPRRIDYSSLGTLRDKIKDDHEPLDIHVFREQPYDPSLRD